LLFAGHLIIAPTLPPHPWLRVLDCDPPPACVLTSSYYSRIYAHSAHPPPVPCTHPTSSSGEGIKLATHLSLPRCHGPGLPHGSCIGNTAFLDHVLAARRTPFSPPRLPLRFLHYTIADHRLCHAAALDSFVLPLSRPVPPLDFTIFRTFFTDGSRGYLHTLRICIRSLRFSWVRHFAVHWTSFTNHCTLPRRFFATLCFVLHMPRYINRFARRAGFCRFTWWVFIPADTAVSYAARFKFVHFLWLRFLGCLRPLRGRFPVLGSAFSAVHLHHCCFAPLSLRAADLIFTHPGHLCCIYRFTVLHQLREDVRGPWFRFPTAGTPWTLHTRHPYCRGTPYRTRRFKHSPLCLPRVCLPRFCTAQRSWFGCINAFRAFTAPPVRAVLVPAAMRIWASFSHPLRMPPHPGLAFARTGMLIFPFTPLRFCAPACLRRTAPLPQRFSFVPSPTPLFCRFHACALRVAQVFAPVRGRLNVAPPTTATLCACCSCGHPSTNVCVRFALLPCAPTYMLRRSLLGRAFAYLCALH